MGSITTSISNIIDNVTDIAAVKSGIILNKSELAELLGSDFDYLVSKFDRPGSGIRLRSEEYEDLILQVRYRLGDIADPTPGVFAGIAILRPWFESDYDVVGLNRRFIQMASKLPRGPKGIDPSPITNQFISEGIPAELVRDLLKSIMISQERDIYIRNTDNIEGTPLNKLFTAEAEAEHTGRFMEQKFLNYLAVNPEKTERIHWRNFERLCAEYFDRNGYTVELGPGRDDGGIDIFARSAELSSDGLIVIQCKRYKKDKDVPIETVKAFYTDVEDGKAAKGIIATTSRIAPGGKKVAIARNYPLEFAESEEVRRWIANMHRPK